MISKQRCCAHCPGNPVSSMNRKQHECNVPSYVSGNLKPSALQKVTAGEEERCKRLQKRPPIERKTGPNNDPNMFSIAKKFHAENLQHQPLPDRIEDRIFANSIRKNGIMGCACIRNAIKRCQSIVPKSPSKILSSPKKPYVPELGCKQPESNMDLAICWEIPRNPVYEPRKPSHIDGSNGGAAPSIFTLIHRHPDMGNDCTNETGVCQNKKDDDECCLCSQTQEKTDDDDKYNIHNTLEENDVNPNHELCQNLDSITISKHVCGKATKQISAHNGRRSKYSRQLRYCAACDDEKNREPKVRMQSASYFLNRTNINNDIRNGIPSKGMLVPRPRTPFARRNYCIDTLAPPFNVVTGSRDADYPEHWRLTSIYQQSYRNPKKQRGTILKYHQS